MRLVCPNCDAEYEVDDAAIPRAGRDVQCSNCGHAWFQLHPEAIAEQAEEEALFGAPPDAGTAAQDAHLAEDVDAGMAAAPAEDLTEDEAEETADEPAEETAAEQAAEPAEERAEETAPEPEAVLAALPGLLPDPGMAEAEAAAAVEAQAAGVQSAAAQTARADTPPGRNIDESILAVLREEAARETAARRAETPAALETQTEMTLDPAASRRVTRLKADAEVKPVAAPVGVVAEATRSRRDLLPAIEEINSTLRATSDRDGEGDMSDMETPSRQKGGFGRGFLTLVLIGVILLALYVFAPLIAEKVPSLAGAAASYVAGVDAARVWLDGEIRSLIGMLRGLEGSSQG